LLANPKKFWNYVNTRLKNINHVGDLRIKSENGEERVISNDKEKADIFCDYFSSIFCMEGEEEFEIMSSKTEKVNTEEVKFEVADITSRLNALNVNKSEGVDNIHPRVLYELRNVLAVPLKIIFEQSYKHKYLPEDRRSADVAPICKKGSKAQVSNCRPIRQSGICCKIMESIIRDNIM
jgi:hypothetical protein